MAPRLTRVPRFESLPPLPLALLLAWSCFVVSAHLLNRMLHADLTLCLFKRLTGLPCATCGGTRCAFSLLELRPVDAFVYNPLVAVGLVAFALWCVLRFGLGRSLSLNLTARERRAGYAVLVFALAANWAYLISVHR